MIREQQLKKYKGFATLLLILMAAIYVVCELFLGHITWIGYVKAFAEAGMVGALADWFAVVALFRHPLGIPIPHTNLIEASKQRIGNNLGNFVTENFLNSKAIKPRLKKLKIAAKLGEWLMIKNQREKVVSEVMRIIREAFIKMDEKQVQAIIYRQSQELVNKIPVNKIVAEGLEKLLKEDLQQDWITALAGYTRDFLSHNAGLVKMKVKEESHFLVPGFVDNAIAAKITNGGIRYMNEIAENEEHPMRAALKKKMGEIAADIAAGGQWAQRLQNIKDRFLSPASLEQYSGMAWQYVKQQILLDLEKNDSGIGNYLDKILHEMGETLSTDSVKQEGIDQFIRVQAYKLVMRYRNTAGEMISQTVSNWPARELSNKLELEVGKDLQFIRVNGTLVGGMVGLLIYIFTRLMH